MPESQPDLAALLAEAAKLYPGVRIGQPGSSPQYWPLIAGLRLLRLRWQVRVEGAENVARGATILVGNHLDVMDPVLVVMGTWWRVSAFTKIEWFQSRMSVFFRLMGQIPLRRGDEESTELALRMAHYALGRGGKVGIYPEGTRSPNPAELHKLHKRLLIPLLRENPEVPVHAVTIAYSGGGRARRIRVLIRVSPPLQIDPTRMSADEMVERIREAILQLSGQTYVDRYAQEVKAEAPGNGRTAGPG